MPGALTLMDLHRRLGANDEIAKIIEILNETNDALDDVVWLEANMGTSHKSTTRTGIPEPAFRELNRGVKPTKSTTAQIVDHCAMLENYLEVDRDLADLSGNRNEFLLSESRPKIEGFKQKLMRTIFYGKKADTKEFVGLTERFNSKNAKSGENIIDAGGKTANKQTSIWLVGWSENTISGLYPKGSKAGMQLGPTKEETLTDSDGGLYEGIRKHFKWDCGLAVRDWRYAVRICNVDMPAVISGALTADLIKYMIMASEQVPNEVPVKFSFYCNKHVRTALRLQILNKQNVNLTFDTVAGKRVLAFDDIPVRRVDQLSTVEAVLG